MAENSDIMKILLALISFLTLLESTCAGAAPPQVTIGVNGGTDGAINLKPAIKWVTDAEVGGLDVEGGMISVIEDLGSISYNVWGKVKKSFGDFAVSGRADVASDSTDIIDLDLRVEGQNGAMLQASATTGEGEVNLNSIQAKGGFGLGPGDVTINPRYNLKSSKANVVIGYGMEKTSFGVTASTDSQTFTVSQYVGDNTIVSPSITTNGDFSLAVKQKLEKGTVTGTFKSNDYVGLEWADGPWVANVIAPIEGYTYNGIKVSAKKKVDF